MLVLSRYAGESIVIGRDIEKLVEITVVDIRGDKIRLSIKAPNEIPVHRKEVYDAIKKEEQSRNYINPQSIPPQSTSPQSSYGNR